VSEGEQRWSAAWTERFEVGHAAEGKLYHVFVKLTPNYAVTHVIGLKAKFESFGEKRKRKRKINLYKD